MTEITQRYGDFKQFSSTINYNIIDTVARYPLRACGGFAPSLARVEKTYGKGTSATWVYDTLQATLLFLGVTEDKFSQMHVLELAKTIASQYFMLKTTEVLLFLARFKGGKYGRFYGGDSYALVIMEALDKFYTQDRKEILRELNNQEQERKREEYKKNVMTREEWIEIKTIIAMYNSNYTIEY